MTTQPEPPGNDVPDYDADEDLELEPDDSVFDAYAAELFGKRDDER